MKMISVICIAILTCQTLDYSYGKTLNLLGMLSKNSASYRSAGSCLTATQMAIDDVNKCDTILKDYDLVYNWIDSKCDPGSALDRMFRRLYSDPPYIMLLGAACSVATEATAQVSYMWNLTQVSYESSSPILSSRARFPRFFRVYPPDQNLNFARIALMNYFNWKKVATIHEAREFFSAVIGHFIQTLEGTEMTVVSQEIFVYEPFTKVENLKKQDSRIIITAMYEDMARETLCAAFKTGLYGPHIVWMFTGWYSKLFWKENLDEIDCTEEEMALAVEGAILTGAVFLNPVEERGVANITAMEFEKLYKNHSLYSQEWASSDHIAPFCYDHIWVSAMALNCADRNMQENGRNKSLDEFTYSDVDIGDTIFKCMSDISMTGVSGRLSYRNSSDPDRSIEIERIQDGERIKIALYRQDVANKRFEWVPGALRWKNGIIPRDSSYITYKEVEISTFLYTLMTSLASIGICLALVFFTINVKYRNNGYVKLSSPNINNMLLLGCILCYCTVFFKSMETNSDLVCKARIYSFCLGFTITFGALFSKTWRVYRIFTNKKLIRMRIKDRQLFLVNGVLVCAILIVLIVWEFTGAETVHVKLLEKEVYETPDGTTIQPYIRVCRSEKSVYFNWTLRVIQGSLLAFGAFLAWETKRIRLEALNDSQRIGLCLYNVVVLSAVGVTLTLVLDDQDVLLYGITSGFLIFGTTTTQLIIFIPKIQAIANKVDVRTISTITRNDMRADTTVSRARDNTLVT